MLYSTISFIFKHTKTLKVCFIIDLLISRDHWSCDYIAKKFGCPALVWAWTVWNLYAVCQGNSKCVKSRESHENTEIVSSGYEQGGDRKWCFL